MNRTKKVDPVPKKRKEVVICAQLGQVLLAQLFGGYARRCCFTLTLATELCFQRESPDL
jgi:hypothetical protein